MNDKLEEIQKLYDQLKNARNSMALDLIQLGIATPEIRQFFDRLDEILSGE